MDKNIFIATKGEGRFKALKKVLLEYRFKTNNIRRSNDFLIRSHPALIEEYFMDTGEVKKLPDLIIIDFEFQSFLNGVGFMDHIFSSKIIPNNTPVIYLFNEIDRKYLENEEKLKDSAFFWNYNQQINEVREDLIYKIKSVFLKFNLKELKN